MAHAVLMPSAGQSMTEGRIVVWLKKEGDPVERGEALLEIETDKANLEVEALHDGVLRKIFHAEGETCAVLSPIAVIGGADEEIDFEAVRAEAASQAGAPAADATPPAPPPEPPPPPAAKPTPPAPPPAAAEPTRSQRDNGDRGRTAGASPAARTLAASRGVALADLRGSGPRGRILRRDVEGAAAAPTSSAAAFLDRAPYPPASPKPPSRVEMTGMRGAIAKALQASKQNIPHFYETIAVDMTAALELRERKRQSGVKLSVNDLIVRATVLALGDEPRVNCRVFDGYIEYPDAVNLGIAVAVDEGLVVPVLLGAGNRDLEGLAAEGRRIVEAARNGKLIGSGQGTFTISNLGMFGIESFSAIINPPEGGILAVGEVRTEPVAFAGGFVPRSVMRVTISCDHRGIDGALAARFLARIRSLLENPERL